MKKLILYFLIPGVFASPDPASCQESNGERSITISPKVFVGAAAIIGVTSPGFSYGAGLRSTYENSASPAGIYLDIDWNRRGGIDQGLTNAVNDDKVEPYNLHYIDLCLGPFIGKKFFFASGPNLGFLVSKGSGADFADKIKNFEIGGYITTGYIFNTRPAISLGADFKMGFTSLYDAYYFETSNNIIWGLSLRIGP